MSDLLSIGASGLRAYSGALSVVGDNIANAQTQGYVRRTARLAEPVPGGDNVIYRPQISADGVSIAGVTRATDRFLTEDARATGSEAARTGVRRTWLEAAETALDDGGLGVGRSLTALFNRADELAADPANAARRSAFLQSADDLASTVRRTADGLSAASTGTLQAAQGGVAQLNTDVASLARVNDALRRARDGSSNQASLLDERDRLIDSINKTLPANVSYEPRGAATLTLPGGATLLAGATQANVSVSALADGRLAFTLVSPAGDQPLSPTGGLLGGLVEGAAHIADQRAAVDTLAANIAAQLNSQHAAGRDASGNPGIALFAIGSGAASMTAIALTTGQVAAADLTSANGNALAFGNLRGTGGGESSWAALVAQQSQAVAGARAQDSAATSRHEGATNARDAISGVDLDREAADLIRFQQAYDAAARVIQVARETMQSIMNAI